MQDRISLLIADDRDKERAALKKQLSECGIDFTITAETGVGAEAITASQDSKPDIVLLSLEEPLTRPLHILQSLVSAGMTVIVVSSIGDRNCLRKAMRAGAKEYLVKPLDAGELANTIEMIFVTEHQKKCDETGGPIPTRAHGEVISILSAKGGTGKTTLAANLAVALAMETDRRVALFDLSLGQGDIPVMLDILPEKTILDLIQIIDRVEPDMIDGFLCQHSSGVKVLSTPAEVKAGELVTSKHVAKIVKLLATGFDYVVIDTPPNLHATVMAALECSNTIFLISTPEIPCLKNTKMMLELLKTHYPHGGKVKLVMNEAYARDGISHSTAGKALDYPIFWKMPHDSLVVESIKLGKPFVLARADGKIARNIVDLARTIGGVQKPRKKLFGLFGK